MTRGARCAAEAPERFFIYPGRTCGFAPKIFGSGRYNPKVRRRPGHPSELSARQNVVVFR
jgi:hypothetical protein